MTSYSPVFDVLANGEWVRRGMVWHWVANEPPEKDEDGAYTPHDLIACGTCYARMDERCKTTTGKDHNRRLVKRVCACGGSIRPREQICGWCRAEQERGAA